MSLNQIQQNRDRQARFYAANKGRINAEKQNVRDSLILQIIDPDIGIIFDEDTVINMMNDIDMNEQTRKKKIANIKIIFTAYPSNNLKKSLNNYDVMRERLETVKTITNPSKTYGYETIKTIIQTILWTVITLNIPIKKDVFNKYKNLVGILKEKSIQQKNEDKADEDNAVIPYTEYLEKIKTRFSDNSKQYLIALIYNTITCRDDIASLKIIQYKKEILPDNNYLLINKKGDGSIILQNYKTQSKYGKLTTALPCVLIEYLHKYIKNNNLTEFLFPENYNNGLTKYISDMNHKIGISGGINIIRRMKITDFLKDPDLTPEQRADFANKSCHSLESQAYYNYPTKE